MHSGDNRCNGWVSSHVMRLNVKKPKSQLQQVAGDRQTGHHDAHHAHQLDEDVQRRT